MYIVTFKEEIREAVILKVEWGHRVWKRIDRKEEESHVILFQLNYFENYCYLILLKLICLPFMWSLKPSELKHFTNFELTCVLDLCILSHDI